MTLVTPKRDPRCTGACLGDRASWEPPTTMVTGRPACPCCGYFLTRSRSTEIGRPPNLNPEIADNTIRFEDDICRFNVVFVREVKPRGDHVSGVREG